MKYIIHVVQTKLFHSVGYIHSDHFVLYHLQFLFQTVCKTFIPTGTCIIKMTLYTPGIQKHVTVLNTRNGDILRSGNIKGGMFWCLHINTFEDVSTRDVHIYLEHNFWDNSMKFHILMWYIKLKIQFYYFWFSVFSDVIGSNKLIV